MFKKLPLNTIKNTRNTLTKMIREYWKNGTDEEKPVAYWRVLTSMFGELIRAHRTEKEFEIESRLESIEKVLREQGHKI